MRTRPPLLGACRAIESAGPREACLNFPGTARVTLTAGTALLPRLSRRLHDAPRDCKQIRSSHVTVARSTPKRRWTRRRVSTCAGPIARQTCWWSKAMCLGNMRAQIQSPSEHARRAIWRAIAQHLQRPRHGRSDESPRPTKRSTSVTTLLSSIGLGNTPCALWIASPVGGRIRPSRCMSRTALAPRHSRVRRFRF